MQTIDYKIPAGHELLACSVDYAGDASRPSIICLHGGGPSGKASTQYLAAHLQKNGKSVIRFDFSGQGESTGEMADSSLKKRLAETKAVMDRFNMGGKISVIGSSMGGYIACALAKEIQIENLILFGPAAYTIRAWDLPFGSGFTETIRAENSFMDSDIVDLLAHYHGRALFIIGEHDEIIPKPVVALYMQALSGCSVFEKYTVPDCPHPIHRWVMKNPHARAEIENRVLNFIESA